MRTDLGTLAGNNANYSQGLAINNAGQVVGISTNSPTMLFGGNFLGSASYYAFLWTNGKMKEIGGAQSANPQELRSRSHNNVTDRPWHPNFLNVPFFQEGDSGFKIVSIEVSHSRSDQLLTGKTRRDIGCP